MAADEKVDPINLKPDRHELTVQFAVGAGEEWRDADGNIWTVTGFVGSSVNFERKLYTQVVAREVVRQWEKVEQ